ncbi:cytochrome P450 [Streptomyces sp. NPDC051320]|uniref:cytochrome P450 n=1 Tax=Streptomyces sp. NPDC051320 TaxID=3154644 RepID=UPI00342571B5
MTSPVHEFDHYQEVLAALADPVLVPLPAAGSGVPGTMAWLRATVARFSSGDAHTRRRALVEADLARLDRAALGAAAASGPDGDTRLLVVRTLARELGLPDPTAVAEAIGIVARSYFGGDDPDADAAVAWLLPRVHPAGTEAHGGPDDGADEVAANRIGLLVQACDATSGLIDRAAGAVRRAADDDRAGYCCSTEALPNEALPTEALPTEILPTEALPTEALLTEVLRYDPPVRVMRRLAVRDTRIAGTDIAEGDLVTLDIAAANRDPEVFPDPGTFDPERTGPPSLTFGSPPRVCPGRDHALALATGILDRAPVDDPADDTPATDDRDPADVVAAMVEHVLALASTWTAWDGRPFPADDRVYTPHKAIRRVTDHLVDHLAELEARLAGEVPQPDHWHASAITTGADLSPFTRQDLDEARSRLTRLAGIWTNRLHTLTPEQLDHSPGAGWTFRQLAFHLVGSAYYADAIGNLTATDTDPGTP